MNNEIKKLKNLIEKYHKLVEKENFNAIEKLCEDGDIYSACDTIAAENNLTVFETKGFDSPGYDIQSYVFTWVENGKIEGIVLNVESF